MSELRELYQEVILDHGRNPRNFSELPDATHSKEGFNPLCGDKVKIYLREQNEKIEDISFSGCGCAISMASTSLMIETIKGKSIKSIVSTFELFQKLLTGEELTELELESLGKLFVLKGVAEFPARVKCATLAWHTLKAILDNDSSKISTE